MTQNKEQHQTDQTDPPDLLEIHLDLLKDAIEIGSFSKIKAKLSTLDESDLAHLIESSPLYARKLFWEFTPQDLKGEVLQALSDEVQNYFLKQMDAQAVVETTAGLETDDLADLIQQLPEELIQDVLRAMQARDRQRLEQVLAFPEDSAGGLMNTDTITVRPRHTLDVVLRYLRRHADLPHMTDNIIIVNRLDQFVGLLPVSTLLVKDPSITVREVMETDVEPLLANAPATEVARLFEKHNWVSAPVVNEDGRLLGRVTIDDVVDVIREDADHSFMNMGGLDEDEDTFGPVMVAARKRAIWLGINLITAILASVVISLFEDSLEKVVALAIMMPIVASMGGVAGSQTLTLVIRSMALGQISKANAFWLIRREMFVGMINSLVWALLLAVITFYWFDDAKLGMIIGAAMMINLITAALSGAVLPMILKRLDIDPAIAGSVALTTVTDVVGFCAFLGLATYVYM